MAVVILVILNDPIDHIPFYPSPLHTYVRMILFIIRTCYTNMYTDLRYHNITSDIIISRTRYAYSQNILVLSFILHVLSIRTHVCMYTICLFFILTCTVSTLLVSVFAVCVLNKSFYTLHISTRCRYTCNFE